MAARVSLRKKLRNGLANRAFAGLWRDTLMRYGFMHAKGITFDTGFVSAGTTTREPFDPKVVKREAAKSSSSQAPR